VRLRGAREMTPNEMKLSRRAKTEASHAEKRGATTARGRLQRLVRSLVIQRERII
jgi:hypothetical protein